MRIMTSTQDINIQQTLHGYKNGHGLISSSLKLSSESLRAMLVLSDMSGASMVKGFDSYLTGYPLLDDGFYALAKTWHAPEMNRPGCVWTHTLLIKNSDLAKIKDLSLLLNLFKRPGVPIEADLYQGKLRLNDYGSYSNKGLGNLNLVDYEELVESIYVSHGSAYLFASDAAIYERVVFDVWSQQWPRLRRNFSFCTGSICDRNSSARTFDLQIMPLQKKREISGKITIDEKMRNSLSGRSDLLEIVVEDLLGKSEDSFRKFLWDYGADIENSKAALLPLTEIYKYSKELDVDYSKSEKIINILGEKFNEKTDAAQLKKSIFDLFCDFDSVNCKKTDEMFLYHLAQTPYQDSFDGGKIGIDEKIANLWKEDKGETLDFISGLLSLELNSHGQSLVKSFSAVIELSDIDFISNEKPHILYVLASLKPSLLADSRLWGVMVENQLSLLSEAIQGGRLEVKSHFDIFSAILDSGADVCASELVDIFGVPAIGFYLQWFDLRKKPVLAKVTSGWDREIKSNLSVAIDWIGNKSGLKDETVAFFLSFLSPREIEVKMIASNVLLSFSGRGFGTLSPRDLCNIRSFFLCLGFYGVGDKPYVFISESFQEVHNAAKENRLSSANWRPLEKYLPELGWWREWDKCERLRRGLANVFFENNWPVEYFLYAIRDKKTFEEIISFLKRKSWGRKFLQKIKDSNALSDPDLERFKVKMLK
jgi:hypothetical protein